MGNDGGSFATRRDITKLKAKAATVEKDDALNARWKACNLSKEPLREPIVACELGNLYNKEEMIRFLIDRSTFGNPPQLSHIRRSKDLTDLRLSRTKEGGSGDAQFCCPITAYPMNGRYRFVYLRKCGCVFSEKAVREVAGDTCPQCNAAYTGDDVVPIYGDEAEVERLRARMLLVRASAKETGKDRREAAAAATAAAAGSASANAKRSHVEISAGIDTKAIVEQAEKRAREQTDAVKSLFADPNQSAKGSNTWVSRGSHFAYIS